MFQFQKQLTPWKTTIVPVFRFARGVRATARATMPMLQKMLNFLTGLTRALSEG